MSVEYTSRDIVTDLERAAANYRGIPVDAICTHCKQVKIHRITPEEVGLHPQIDPLHVDPAEATSFKHVCYSCGTVSWWNILGVLKGQVRRERGDRE